MGVPPVTATPPPFRTVAPRPRSPSAEVDIDGERGTPDPDAAAEEDARDEDSHAIVSQLEKGVPRWQGLEDVGFNEDLTVVRTNLSLIQGILSHATGSVHRTCQCD
jgi:chromatin structure-remodeling complex subunit RSC1/2